VKLFQNWFKKRVMAVADGAYAERPFLKRVMATRGLGGQQAEEGRHSFRSSCDGKTLRQKTSAKVWRESHLAGTSWWSQQSWTSAQMKLYGKEQTVTFKTFLATYAARRWRDSSCDRKAIARAVFRLRGRVGGLFLHGCRRPCRDNYRTCGRSLGVRTEFP
jgi:hypothetical protein